MSRIRSIKPEFWTSDQIVECSPSARLLFIGLWTFADDRGVIPRRPRTIKMQVFPGDDFTTEQIEQWLFDLESHRLLGRFSANGETYVVVTGWHHQKIERPTYKYPAPPETLELLADTSPTYRRHIADTSPPEWKGVDGSIDPPLPPRGKKRFDETRFAELTWPESLDNDAGRKALAEWLRHKFDKGSPYKSTAGPQKILNHFGRWTPVEFQAAVDASIENNYQGLFPAKENGKPRQREFPQAQTVPPMPDASKGERYIP